MKRIAISGSHGLVGSSLVPLLMRAGYEVRRIVRKGSEPSADDISFDAIESGRGDEVFGDVDAVVHLAGENIASGRWTDEKKKAIRESRVESTKAISQCLARMKQPPKVLVCASATGYYGDRGGETLTEGSPAGSGFLAELCADWERATVPAAGASVRVVNIRLGIVLSPKAGALAKMLPPFRAGAGGPFGDGHQYMSWITIDDVAGAILHSLASDKLSGPVNLVAPSPVTNREFSETLAKVLHRPAFFPVPAFGARLLFGEMADALLLSSARVQPDKLVSSGYAFQYPQLEPALVHLIQN